MKTIFLKTVFLIEWFATLFSWPLLAVMSSNSHSVAPSICLIHSYELVQQLNNSFTSTSFFHVNWSVSSSLTATISSVIPAPLRHLSHLRSEILSACFIHTCNGWLRSNGDLKYDKSICWTQIESVTPTTAIDHNHTIMKWWDTLALWGGVGCFGKMAHVKPHLYKWALDLSQSRGWKTRYIKSWHI